jgi:galactose-1-phosphate uridylyltransferase
MNSILNLEDKIDELKEKDKDSYNLFKSVFEVSSATGTMEIPHTFKDKVRTYFGNRNAEGNITETADEVIGRIRTQKVVKTYNRWAGIGSLFNSLRASRPGIRPDELQNEKKKVEEYIEKSREGCDFCDPEKYTPEDIFGRIKGKHCITGANIAKYDAWSSMIFFNKHNPLDFNLEELSDYIDTGFKWFKKVNSHDKRFKFPFFLWNCLPKAGASQVHGHAQILMADNIPYAKTAILRKIFRNYMQLKGRNYFKDIYTIHKDLGLALEDVKGFASITPLKEKEFIIISKENPSKEEDIKKAVYEVLRCYIDKLGVNSFNMAISCPESRETMFPYIIYIVDRGSIFKPTADIGTMELYGSSVISDDPYNFINILKDFM